jgi:hypothetical protein
LILAPNAGALRFPPGGLRYQALFASRVGGATLLSVETSKGTLGALSFRVKQDVQVRVPVGVAGKEVGTRSTSGGVRRLTWPRGHAGRAVTLLHRGNLRVVIRPRGAEQSAAKVVLSVYGLPAGASGVEIRFADAGAGLLSISHSCPAHPRLEVFAQRIGASEVRARTGTDC